MVDWSKFYNVPAQDLAGLGVGILAPFPILLAEQVVCAATVESKWPGVIPFAAFTVTDGLMASYAMNTAKESSGVWRSFDYGVTGSFLTSSVTNLIGTIVLLAFGGELPQTKAMGEMINKLKDVHESSIEDLNEIEEVVNEKPLARGIPD